MGTELPEDERLKVIVYATWNGRLLTFREPDFAEVGLQVPGGTIEAGEDLETAARREFSEESGLPADGDLRYLGYALHRPTSGAVTAHHRRFFHLLLEGDFREEWETLEAFPSGGGPPIRFRFGWSGSDVQLAAELGAFLHAVETMSRSQSTNSIR